MENGPYIKLEVPHDTESSQSYRSKKMRVIYIGNQKGRQCYHKAIGNNRENTLSVFLLNIHININIYICS